MVEPSSPPMNPMDAFLDDLPQPAVDTKDTIHGLVSEFHLPTLSSPLLLYQDVGPGCGGKTWPAGEVLSNYMIRKYKGTDLLKGKTILELGSGTGLVGLAIAKEVDLGEGTLYITDQKNMVDIMAANINLNSVGTKVVACELDWGEPVSEVLASPDIVLAADCVYFEPAFPLLQSTLRRLTEGRNVEVYMAYKKRRKADKRFFTGVRKDFDIAEVLDDIDQEMYRMNSVYLYRLTRKQNQPQPIPP